jgi:hypothetical protein
MPEVCDALPDGDWTAMELAGKDQLPHWTHAGHHGDEVAGVFQPVSPQFTSPSASALRIAGTCCPSQGMFSRCSGV